jgi:hypothetical protein
LGLDWATSAAARRRPESPGFSHGEGQPTPELVNTTQLLNQYASKPPVHSGDPTEASPELVISITQSQASFVAGLIAATQQVLGQT